MENDFKELPEWLKLCWELAPNIARQAESELIKYRVQNQQMLEALIYFVKRVREGSIRSKTTYNMYIGIIESATGLSIEEVLAEWK